MKHFSDLSPTAERIVDIAERLIQQRGFNGFSYEDIASEIGIRKPSIHHHFSSKDSLAIVVAQRYTYRVKKQLLAIEESGQTYQAQLTQYAELFDKTYSDERRLCPFGILGAECATLSESIRFEIGRFFSANLEWLAEVLGRGRIAGEFSYAIADKEQALIVLSALEGSMVIGKGMESALCPKQVGQALIASLIAR
jgi:TetR/AcrR family transcriptional repressor of nem operon